MTDLIVVPEQKEWWIEVHGKPSGPCSEAYIRAAMRCGLVHSDQLATPVDGSAWQRVVDWPEFSRTSPRPERRDEAAWFGREVWNPFFHRVISWYFLVGTPAVLCVSWLRMTLQPHAYLHSSRVWEAQFNIAVWELAISLGLTVLGVVGGLRLRHRMSDARFWLIGVVVAGWVFSVITTRTAVVLHAVADEASRNPHLATFDEAGPGAAISILESFVAAFVWLIELTTVVWLGLRCDSHPTAPSGPPRN